MSSAHIDSRIAYISRHGSQNIRKLECGPMPNVTAEYRWRSLFNAAVWMTPTTRVPCSNAAKTRNPLKFAGVPQTPEPISAASAPKFTEVHYQDMWRRYCCLTSFFPIVDTSLSCEDICRQSCAMVPRWRFLATFLGPALAASHMQHISDLHSKFALRPHHV